MKAILTVFALTLLIFCAASSTMAEIVTINAALLPGSPQASYTHCWAAAGNAGTNHVPHPGGKTDTTGADIACDASRSSGGNFATAHSRARVTGGVLLEATVNATKVTFAAAAAYAQGGGQVKKSGVNKSAFLVVEISGLKVSGRRDPMDDEVMLELTNLQPRQINQTMIEEVIPDKTLRAAIVESVNQSGFQLTDLTDEPYLKVHAKITAENKFTVTASAPLLCDPQKLKGAGVDVDKLSSPSEAFQAAANRVLDLMKTEPARFEEFCSPQRNVVQTASFERKSRQENKDSVHEAVLKKNERLRYVIVIPENNPSSDESNNFSVSSIQFTSSRQF